MAYIQIAAFMQLSRAKQKDGRRETFEGVFNRIDTEGWCSIPPSRLTFVPKSWAWEDPFCFLGNLQDCI